MPGRDYKESAENLRKQAIARLNSDIAPPDGSQPQAEKPQQFVCEQETEQSDRRLLKYFFGFSLVLSSFLALVAPSGATIGIVLSVIGLGTPLFSTHPKAKSKSPNNNSAYGIHISKPWWLFIAFCTLGMPFVFGWWFGKDPALFFILAFFGLAIGTILLTLAMLTTDSKR